MEFKIKKACIEYGPVNNTYGFRNVRWVENVSRGLRFVGFADEIARKEGRRGIDHKGWFTMDDGDTGEVYRGVVFQLPSRNGLPYYVYGYDDPNNPDCALLCFDAPKMEKYEAACAADRFAEIYAEHEREYRRAWDAGNQWRELGEEIADMRSEALRLGREARQLKAVPGEVPLPGLLRMAREKIKSLYREIQRARKKRAELVELFDGEDGFTEAIING